MPQPQTYRSRASDRTPVCSPTAVGTVGLTETAARAEFGDAAVKVRRSSAPPSPCSLTPCLLLQVYEARFTPMLFGLMDDEDAAHHKTAMKLVCVGEAQRVAGVHIIGEGADEMLQVRP